VLRSHVGNLVSWRAWRERRWLLNFMGRFFGENFWHFVVKLLSFLGCFDHCFLNGFTSIDGIVGPQGWTDALSRGGQSWLSFSSARDLWVLLIPLASSKLMLWLGTLKTLGVLLWPLWIIIWGSFSRALTWLFLGGCWLFVGFTSGLSHSNYVIFINVFDIISNQILNLKD
jgi:hypothetical protein